MTPSLGSGFGVRLWSSLPPRPRLQPEYPSPPAEPNSHTATPNSKNGTKVGRRRRAAVGAPSGYAVTWWLSVTLQTNTAVTEIGNAGSSQKPFIAAFVRDVGSFFLFFSLRGEL